MKRAPDIRNKSSFLFIFTCLSYLFCAAATAATIYVPTDQPTIQAGIDAAANGDTVIVESGTYNGVGNRDIDFKGKAITVRSESGPGSTTIDCEGLGRGFYFHTNENQNSVLEGFRIINGLAGYGGAIAFFKSYPTINGCILEENQATSGGGGISGYNSAPTVTNTIIADNDAVDGGAAYFYGSSAPVFMNSTLSDNTASYNGGNVLVRDSTLLTVTNSIIWNGEPDEIYNFSSNDPVITYSDVAGGYVGTGNINQDPNFTGGHDFHLTSSSPCIDAGTASGAPAVDIDGDSRPQGAGYDIGADEYVATGPCPAQTLLQYTVGGDRRLATLRIFRDSILAQDPQGRELIGFYYGHKARLRGLLLDNPDLLLRATALLIEAVPAVAKAVDGGALVVSATLLEDAARLLSELEVRAGGSLADGLATVQDLLRARAGKVRGGFVRIELR